ncbi:MAG: C10 family peptidase [Bacteroidetes bacterium]|nr:C10 family peptidase [Bacteroidota bacterium]
MRTKQALLGLLLLGFISVTFAEKVDVEHARLVATNFLYEKVNQYRQPVDYSTIVIEGVYTEKHEQEATYYVFNIQGGGFIIVAADDLVTPVFGYSYEGAYDPEKYTDNFSGWMKHYSDMVVWVRETGYQAEPETKKAWNHLLTNDITTLSVRGGRDIAPMLISTWDQGSPYNELCPTASGGHCPTGCVATAMAQIMYYWRYPLVGTGSNSYNCPGYGVLTANFGNTYYDWNAMLNSYTPGSPEQSAFAVAQLQYHAGVAVNMQYGPGASGSHSYLAVPALKSFFNYSSSTSRAVRSQYSQTTWEDMLINDLDNGRPLYYSGDNGSEGHAFVCDGYQLGTPNYFHFNFGWSGSGDGYYTADNPQEFSYNQEAIKGIYPDDATYTYPYFCNGSSVVNTTSGTFEDGSGPLADYENGTGCNWLITPKETDSVEYYTISFEKFNTQSGDIVNIYDGETTEAPLLMSHSGDQIPGSVQSSGSKVFVTFTSDGSGTAPGWQIKATPYMPQYCSNMTALTDPTGSFTDGSGDKNYLGSSLCHWNIDVENANHITVNFTSFDLELVNDYLQILDLSTSPPTELGKLSGSMIPGNITGVGPLMITFSTNNIINKGGFAADYEIDNVGVDEKDPFASLSVYPNPATDLLNIRFKIIHSQEIEISLTTTAGYTVYRSDMYRLSGNQDLPVDISNFTSGVYILRIMGDDGIVIRRIIIQK